MKWGMTFTYSVVASPLHDAETVNTVIAPVSEVLAKLGGSRTTTPAQAPTEPHVIVVATGGTEAAALAVVGQRSTAALWEPVVLVTHPGHNSLPAALEILARLQLDGRRGEIVALDSAELGALGTPTEAAVTRLAESISFLEAAHRLRVAKLGLVGTPSDWLVASVPEVEALRGTWGVQMTPIDITDSITAQRTALADGRALLPVVAKYSTPEVTDTAELTAAAALHPALLDSIEAEGVNAVTVRCFDYLGELHTSGCIALAQLNDTGIVAGCEGDVASAVAMMWVRELLDSPSWMANPAAIDPDTDQLLLAHCTVAPSMVNDLSLHTHFESGFGVGLRGTFAPGPVTLIRLGGPGLSKAWIADAMVVGTSDSEHLCRTQVTLDVEPGRVAELLHAPLGNHIVMAFGHHRERLERWRSLML